MKKYILFKFLLPALIVGQFVYSPKIHAAANPRLLALGSMALYGTVGGALLGTASLAFGAKSRAVAVGASLGLYTGLLFGSYVVVSHAYKDHRDKNPVPQENYYPESEGVYENEGAPAGEAGPPGAFMNRENFGDLDRLAISNVVEQEGLKFNGKNFAFYLPLLTYQF